MQTPTHPTDAASQDGAAPGSDNPRNPTPLLRAMAAELEAAGTLLALALQHMTPSAQGRFAAASEAAGLGMDGATRRAEREFILQRARAAIAAGRA